MKESLNHFSAVYYCLPLNGKYRMASLDSGDVSCCCKYTPQELWSLLATLNVKV